MANIFTVMVNMGHTKKQGGYKDSHSWTDGLHSRECQYSFTSAAKPDSDTQIRQEDLIGKATAEHILTVAGMC